MNARKLLCLACAALLALPMLANAEVYKWKDKNGEVRYSDTPPPSNIKQESIGGKKAVKSTGKEPLAPVSDAKAKPANVAKEPGAKDAAVSAEDAAAEKRQRNAELEKHNKEVKEAEAKLKEENCRAAKTNYETYKQGGRVTKMNENGEKYYLDDKALNEGKTKSQLEVDEYCS